jgi:hypothetical protein
MLYAYNGDSLVNYNHDNPLLDTMAVLDNASGREASTQVVAVQGGFTKEERTSSLLYIKPLYIHGAFSAISGDSSVKIWHPQRTDRE